jgi:hypothetical protein
MDVDFYRQEVEVEGEKRGKFTTVLGVGLFVALALLTSILVWVFQFNAGVTFSTAAGLVGIHAISMVLFIFILHGISKSSKANYVLIRIEGIIVPKYLCIYVCISFGFGLIVFVCTACMYIDVYAHRFESILMLFKIRNSN